MIYHVCYGLWTRMECPNYDAARILTEVLQPGFQPRTGATPALEPGFLTRIISARQYKAACQGQEKNDTNKTYNELRIDTGSVN